MKIGIVGYQGAGKSTLFHYLTNVPPDPSLAHATQTANAVVPDLRIGLLTEIYHPKKVTQASLTIVDTPGLSRSHEGSAAKLALIREADCLVVVIGAHANAAAASDLKTFEDDLLIADLDIVSGRMDKLRESIKKPRPNREAELAEIEMLQPLLSQLDAGKPLRELNLSSEQARAIKSFQLLTEKPRFTVVNLADEIADPVPYLQSLGIESPAIAFSVSLNLDLMQLPDDQRSDFCRELELVPMDRDEVLRRIMDISGQMLFFTAGEKEVRSWMIRKERHGRGCCRRYSYRFGSRFCPSGNDELRRSVSPRQRTGRKSSKLDAKGAERL